MAQDLASYREQFPITRHVAYMNHAAAGPVSLPVIDAVESIPGRPSRARLGGGSRFERAVRADPSEDG